MLGKLPKSPEQLYEKTDRNGDCPQTHYEKQHGIPSGAEDVVAAPRLAYDWKVHPAKHRYKRSAHKQHDEQVRKRIVKIQ